MIFEWAPNSSTRLLSLHADAAKLLVMFVAQLFWNSVSFSGDHSSDPCSDGTDADSSSPLTPPVASTATSASAELRATAAMCRHCFDVLIHHIHGDAAFGDSPVHRNPEFLQDLADPSVACPLFVTWDKRRKYRQPHHQLLSNAGAGDAPKTFELRGCIGSLKPKALVPAIGEYALLSALQDRRFPPIRGHEIQHLRVAVSLLICYEPCRHVWDWSVGTHGIVLSWESTVDGRQYSATYLPEVASEQKWDQKTTVESLIRKAGWTTAVTEALLESMSCTRYQSSKIRLSFDDYIEHRRNENNLFLVEDAVEDALRAKKKNSVVAAPANCHIS